MMIRLKTCNRAWTLSALTLLILAVPRVLPGQVTLRAKAWASVNADGTLNPTSSYNSSGALNTVVRLSAGLYQITYPGLGNGSGGMSQISSASPLARCKSRTYTGIAGDMLQVVECRDFGGANIDSPFTALFYRESRQTTAWFDGYLFYLQDPPFPVGESAVNAFWSWNSKGGTNTVTRTGVGTYTAKFGGLGAAPNGGTVLVTSSGADNSYCSTVSWGPVGADIQVNLACFSPGGTPLDTHFLVSFMTDVSVAVNVLTDQTSGAYARADSPSTAAYVPLPLYSLNSTGGAIAASRQLTGRYTMNFAGLPSSNSTIAIATAFGGNSYCSIGTVAAAGNGGADIHVACSNAAGAAADSQYTILYLTAPPLSAALRFVPITPCRIADTRLPAAPFGGPSIAGGTSRDFTISASVCGVPAAAQAFSLNVAVVPSGPLGYLTLHPAGQTRPLVSTLNSLDGRVKSNASIVPGGTGGAVSVFASDTTHVILDINGYFVPTSNPAGLAFYPITPCRIADTRTAPGQLGGPSMGAGQTRTFPILASTCNLPGTAQAYSLNFAAVPGGPLGYITAWPTGHVKPLVASLNAPTGTITANAAIVPAGAGGSVDVFVSDPTNLVIDINGYFAPAGVGGLSLYGVTPCRVKDTRQPPGSPLVTSLDVVVNAPTPCAIPDAAQAHVLGVTVIPPASMGFLTLWQTGQPRPLAATLNALDAAITSNLAIVPAANGSISAFASDPAHLVFDIFAYFGQ